VKSNGDLFIEIGNLKKDHLLNRAKINHLQRKENPNAKNANNEIKGDMPVL
jgi:hypothetical protein